MQNSTYLTRPNSLTAAVISRACSALPVRLTFGTGGSKPLMSGGMEPITALSLSAEMQCCGRVTTLNELDYVWPQGFACVAITLMNPDSDLEPAERQQVELALGLPVRVIWRHI